MKRNLHFQACVKEGRCSSIVGTKRISAVTPSIKRSWTISTGPKNQDLRYLVQAWIDVGPPWV